jgi:hypothetical protein
VTSATVIDVTAEYVTAQLPVFGLTQFAGTAISVSPTAHVVTELWRNPWEQAFTAVRVTVMLEPEALRTMSVPRVDEPNAAVSPPPLAAWYVTAELEVAATGVITLIGGAPDVRCGG